MTKPQQIAIVFQQGSATRVPKILAEHQQFWSHHWRQSSLSEQLVVEHLNRSIASSLFDENVRPHFTPLKQQAFLLFIRGVNLNRGQDPEDMVSLRIYFDGKQLFSITNRNMESINHVHHELQQGDCDISNTRDVFIQILTQVLMRIENYILKLAADIEALEDEFDDHGKVDPSKLHELRRKASRIWRHLLPQQETLRKLSQTNYDWQDEAYNNQLQAFHNSMTIQIEELNLIRERSEILNHEINAKTNEKINKNLYIISMITALFVPLSFLTGLFGINVGGIPGSDNGHAFLIFSLLTLAIAVLQLAILKLFKWF